MIDDCPGGIVKAESLGDGRTRYGEAIAKLRLTLPPIVISMTRSLV